MNKKAFGCAGCPECVRNYKNEPVCCKELKEIPELVYRDMRVPEWCPIEEDRHV